MGGGSFEACGGSSLGVWFLGVAADVMGQLGKSEMELEEYNYYHKSDCCCYLRSVG